MHQFTYLASQIHPHTKTQAYTHMMAKMSNQPSFDQLEVSRASSHTEELWDNETACL